VKLKTKIIAHPILTAVLVLAFVGVAAAAVPVFQATETPQFCRNCHEMGPYYDAWAVGAHKNVSCVDCHVDPGAVNHVEHKVVASQELWIHLTGDPKFPKGTADVPNGRCLACHAGIMDKTGPRFSHKQHAGAGPCIECHSDAGHRVTTESLAKAGILKSGPEASGDATIVPAARRSSATTGTPTHSPVSCTQCHDLAKVACSKCHQPAHPARGECTTCHQPGTRWTFSHPLSEVCASCHAAPAKHFGTVCTSCHSPNVPFAKTVFKHVSQECVSCHAAPAKHRSGACATCHQKPGASWAFSHPGASSCATCHSAPAAHNKAAACASCHHKPGVSWAATHPASSACGSCHRAPANHFGTSCSTCHRPGVAFKSAVYRHTSSACGSCHRAPAKHFGTSCSTCHSPGVPFRSAVYRHTSSACASCHTAPSGHNRAAACAACHKQPGVSWAASHPGSSACASCHRAPANHYGTSCASCHRPLVAWRSATFNHPSTGSEHTYRSFACVRCHPSGYTSHTCTACHGPNGGD
jgi:nitrate/TMAO reductase-like tetraheme cytochrome c subunit